MHESASQSFVVLFIGFVLLAFVLLMRPGYLADPEVLGILVIGQIVVTSVCHYRKSFFLVLMAAFFWAGMQVPLSGAWLEGRWIVLAVGSLAGLAIYMKNRSHRFTTMHLLALFCVLSAVVSASVSAYPQEALLKSLSLFLLFLYGTTGARVAASASERVDFFRKLLLLAEVAVYVCATAYLIFRVPIFGNPNSLGAVMGVVVVPVVFWGFLKADSVNVKRRLGFELCLAVVLLMSTFCRAGIVAAMISCTMLCIGTRRPRLLVSGAVILAAISLLTVLFVPTQVENVRDTHSDSVASLFLHKGKQESGLLSSRKVPWDTTVEVIKSHPWFGSGFGTSTTDLSASYFELTRTRFVDSRMVREHGNSYLAIMEWSGLLGVLPFYFLVVITALQAGKAFSQLRKTCNIYSPAVPAAAIVVAGLVGATFEDWLFAVGYHVSVLFWSIAFTLPDLVRPDMYGEPAQEALLSNDPQLLVTAAR